MLTLSWEADMAKTIEIINLCKTFGTIKAVDSVSLDMYSGQLIALLGPNGAGKSTLMNMLAGYLAPSSGQIKILEKDLTQNPIFAKQNIGFLPEGSPLYGDMSVQGFLSYMAELKSLNRNEVKKTLLLANIEDVAEQKIETLSKGYKRRVGFAVSILSNPPVLLLDEPTDGLDPNQKEHMLGLIREMSKDKTILISTHLLDEAKENAGRILIMNHGQIKADGDIEIIKKQTRTTSLENAFIKLTR